MLAKRVWSLGFRAWGFGLGFRVWGLGLRLYKELEEKC